MVNFSNGTDGAYLQKLCNERLKKYGYHEFCLDCRKKEVCAVPAYPGFEFECNDREVAGAKDREVSDSFPPSAPRKKHHGGW